MIEGTVGVGGVGDTGVGDGTVGEGCVGEGIVGDGCVCDGGVGERTVGVAVGVVTPASMSSTTSVSHRMSGAPPLPSELPLAMPMARISSLAFQEKVISYWVH